MNPDAFEEALDLARSGILLSDTGAPDVLDDAFLRIAGLDPESPEIVAAVAHARKVFASL